MAKIFVEVLEEGTPVFQGIESERLAENIYRIGLPPFPYDPEDLVLRFVPGTVVRCEPHKLHAGKIGPLAVEQIDWPQNLP